MTQLSINDLINTSRIGEVINIKRKDKSVSAKIIDYKAGHKLTYQGNVTPFRIEIKEPDGLLQTWVNLESEAG